MTIKKDAQRYRKIYSYYRPQPRETLFGAGGGVDETVINGLDWKQSVRAATTSNITLSPSPASIDGITLAPDDRVLVKDQSTASANGIYYYDSGTGDLARSDDAVDPALTSAAAVFVEGGVTNGDCAFVLVTPDPITVGTTALSWVKFAGVGSSIFTSSVSPLLAKTNYSVSIDSDNRYANVIGDDVFFFVSGSITSSSTADHKAVFGGDVVVSGNLSVKNGMTVDGDVIEMTGSLTVTDGISGSLTKLSNGSSYLIAGTNITIISQSNGSILINSTGGGGGGGPSYFDSIVAGSIFTTGSAAFVDQEAVTSPSDKGTDVFFYVSGSAGSKDGPTPGVALFGGDVSVSGSLTLPGNFLQVTGTLEVTNGISGSLTQLTDGTSYIVAGTNVTIVSQSNGSLLISSMGGGGSSSFFDSTTDGSTYTTGSTAFIGGESSVDSPLDKGSDVFFYVSGSIGSQGTAVVGTALFGGDLMVSGAFTTDADLLELSGTLKVTNGISGSITQLTDGTSYLIAGNNVTITSGTNGSITISSAGSSTEVFFDSTTAGSVFTTGSFAFRSQESSVDSPDDKGSDVFFYVSGSIGSKGGITQGVSLFGGDVAVSGSLHAEGFSGSLTQLTDGTSYLIAGTNISIVSASNGSVTISNTFQQINDYFDSTTSGSVYTTGSFAFRGDEASVDSPADKGTDVFFYVSGSSNSKGTSTPGVALFGGDVTVSGSFFAEGSDFEITGTLTVTQGISGSLTRLSNGDSYIVAGGNVTVTSSSSGQITISSTLGASYWESTQADIIFTTGSIEATGSLTVKSDFILDGTFRQGDTNLVTGLVSHAQGFLTTGSGNYSHAEGFATIASGNYSHAEGEQTLALGQSSHAEGHYTLALGDKSHAEGYLTTGSGVSSHAEGGETLAIGIYSHAEGYRTTASGTFSHAEGHESYASGTQSHAEGYHSLALGVSSHAEGYFTTASADDSHSEGYRTITYGYASHAEGSETIAWGTKSHAEGFSTLAYGDGSHAEGSFTTASLFASHAEGQNTHASGSSSHAEGYYSITFGFGSHAEGYITTASVDYSHAEGNQTHASGNFSHAEGGNTLTIGESSHAEGGSTTAIGFASHAEGFFTTTTGLGSHAEGAYSTAGGSVSHAEGAYTLTTNDAAHAEGYLTTGSGLGSHAEGYLTIASGNYSHAGGIGTIASGSGQTVFGSYNKRENDFSLFVVGNGTSDADVDRSDIFRVNLGVVGDGQVEVTGSLAATTGFSGSLTTLTDGTSYLIAGTNISIVSQSNGSVTISNTFQQVDDFFDSTTSGSIFTTGSTAFRGQESIDSPSDKGADVFFYVSGSIGSQGTSTAGTALFGGDLVVSGGILLTGDIVEVTGTIAATQGFSGSLTTLADGTSYLIAGANVTVTSASNGGVTIGLAPSLTGSFSGSFSHSTYAFTGSGPFTASLKSFILVDVNTDPTTLYLPSGAPDGFQVIVKRHDPTPNARSLWVSGSNSDTVDNISGSTISANYGSSTFVKLGAGWYIV